MATTIGLRGVGLPEVGEPFLLLAAL